MSAPGVRSWRSARRILWLAAVGPAAAGATGSAAAAAPQPLPGPQPRIHTKISTAGLGLYDIRVGIPNPTLDITRVTWFIDGEPLPGRDGKYAFVLPGNELRDGKLHTVTARMPRKDNPGETYEITAPLQAFKPLILTAPVQSAANAKRRGITIRVSAARGYYRLRAMSARIPAAGGVSFESPSGGARTIRLRGSYLDRIRPGTRLKIRAQRLYRGSILETVVITVRFR